MQYLPRYRWEIIARCSQVSGETRRARSFISRRLFESVIRNEPCEINVIDLVRCHSQLLLNKFPYEIIQYPVIVIYYRKRRWHRYNFIYNIIMHFFFWVTRMQRMCEWRVGQSIFYSDKKGVLCIVSFHMVDC